MCQRIKQSYWPWKFWGCRVFHYSRFGLVLPLSVREWPHLFLGPLIISKNSTLYLSFFVRYCGLKNPEESFWGFWIITQEPDFCKHVVLAKSTKKTLALRAKERKHIYSRVPNKRRGWNNRGLDIVIIINRGVEQG